MNFDAKGLKNHDKLSLNEKSQTLLETLKSFSQEELSKKLKIKENILKKTYSNIINFNNIPCKDAISSYSGTVFKEINWDDYIQSEVLFLKNHFLIFSAFYGILSPFDSIKEYRLDMTAKIFDEFTLYNYWIEWITSRLNNIFKEREEEFLVNLASSEFIKMIDRKNFKYSIIDVDFKEYRGGKYVSVSTYSKKARGMMSDYIIRQGINIPEGIKSFNIDRYLFNQELSSKQKFVFSRKKSADK
jgi:cytoplasmic iron level regulating protein YaaA (DUF328/UPF0246 family)